MNFLYPDLSPQPRFLKILELYILPELEKDGFKFLKNGPSLKRVENSFEWIVNFDGRKYNVENAICRFNPYFMVRNSNYRKYLKQNPQLVGDYGTVGQIGTTSGIQHWNKQLFSSDKTEAYFLEDNDFAKYDNEKLVNDVVTNIRKVGIPYFRMMSDFDTIRDFYFTVGWTSDAPLLIDLCYILDREDQLENVFNWFDKKPCEHTIDEMNVRR